MLPLRYSQRWRIAGVLVLVAVFGATVAPAFGLFSSSAVDRLFEFDKWLHGFTFLFLTVWFTGQYARRAYWRVIVGLTLFGVFIEFCQRFLTYRTSDPADVAANVAGIVLGLAIALAGLGGWSLRVESWLLARRASA